MVFVSASCHEKPLSSIALIALLGVSTLLPTAQIVWAKSLPMGHPSLSIILSAGDDPRFDFLILDEDSIEGLRDEVNNKMYAILERILLPEVRKQFNEKWEVYANGYIEYVSLNYRVEESSLEIFIAKQPEDYKCDTQGCTVRNVKVEVPADLRLSQIRQVSMFIAVYETPLDQQLAERILAKGLNEARFLLSEASSILEDKTEELLSDNIPVERFFLRQYEDISRVTILFSPYEPGDPAKQPIDIVSTENTYYKQAYYRALGEPELSTLEIWSGETPIQTNHSNATIGGRICPEPFTSPGRAPVFDPETNAIMDPGSAVQITYFIASPDGMEEERSELLDSSKELCSEGINKSFVLDKEGIWSVYATATWITLNNYTRADSTREIESNAIILAVASDQVQKCGSLGIRPEECDEVEIMRTEPHQIALSDEEMDRIRDTENQINNSMYIIGIGAAIAGTIAFITLRKRK
jgi:hypothetical protein